MNTQKLKEVIENLDPVPHKALRQALTSEFHRQTQKGEQIDSQTNLAPDPCADLFEKTVDELNRKYLSGTIDFIRKFHSDIYQKINVAEEQLNNVWRECLKQKAGIEEFRDVVHKWYLFNLRAIQLYSQEREKIKNF